MFVSMLMPWMRAGGVVAVATTNYTGSGFGSKSNAAPYRYFDFLGASNGADAMAAEGLDANGDAALMDTYNATGGYARMLIAAGENAWGKDAVVSFTPIDDGGLTPAIGTLLPASTPTIYGTAWVKFTRSSGTYSRRHQLKFPRAGVGSSTDGNANYGASGIKFHNEVLTNTGDGDFDEVDGFYPGWNNSANSSTQGGNEVSATLQTGKEAMFGIWHHLAWYYGCGTAGSSNGFMYGWIDGKLVMQKTSLAVKLGGSTDFTEHCQYVTGLQNLDVADYTIRLSRCHLDTTPQRIELINASSYAAMTAGPIVLRPTAWSDTSVSVLTADIPVVTGYDWVAITSASNTQQVQAR